MNSIHFCILLFKGFMTFLLLLLVFCAEKQHTVIRVCRISESVNDDDYLFRRNHNNNIIMLCKVERWCDVITHWIITNVFWNRIKSSFTFYIRNILNTWLANYCTLRLMHLCINSPCDSTLFLLTVLFILHIHTHTHICSQTS